MNTRMIWKQSINFSSKNLWIHDSGVAPILNQSGRLTQNQTHRFDVFGELFFIVHSFSSLIMHVLPEPEDRLATRFIHVLFRIAQLLIPVGPDQDIIQFEVSGCQ